MIGLSKYEEPKLRDPKKKTIVIFQGEIAVSKDGNTSICSPGYEGRLGLIIASLTGPGGLVAHIAETGQKKPASRKEYILQSVDLVLGLAVARPKSPFDVALFRGWGNETTLDWGLKNNARVNHILDLRALSYEKPYSTEIPLHPVHADGNGIDQAEVFRVLGEDGREVAMNNMAKLPFELSVLISRARLKPRRGTGICGGLICLVRRWR